MAGKAKSYRVVGAAAVIRKGKAENYLYQGAVFDADQLNEDNAEHLLRIGLIEEFKPVAEDSESAPEPYEGVTVADLRSEIDKRNKDRAEDKVIKPGGANRPDLVAALVADDAAAAA